MCTKYSPLQELMHIIRLAQAAKTARPVTSMTDASMLCCGQST